MKKHSTVTRREALKFASIGMLGALGAPSLLAEDAPAG
jgi:branched-subunit amino acid transport protein